MREIKFRVFDDNEMFYWGIGDVNNDGSSCTFPSGHLIKLHQMQYTGLKDKNGVEIYEGDIVKKHRLIKYVEFKRGAFLLSGDVILLAHFGDTIEVIGNIYENPELLEDN